MKNSVVTTVTKTTKRSVILSEEELCEILRAYFNMNKAATVTIDAGRDYLRSVMLEDIVTEEVTDAEA